MKYWEIIADNLKKAGWSWGYVSAVDCEGRTIWIADAHRGDGTTALCRQNQKNREDPLAAVQGRISERQPKRNSHLRCAKGRAETVFWKDSIAEKMFLTLAI
jgi:hypothetical protein